MSLKVTGLQVSVDTVLSSRQICYFSPNFSRTMGSEASEKWGAKSFFAPFIEIWRGIHPSCPTTCFTPA